MRRQMVTTMYNNTKLFLDIVPSSLRGCFRGGFVYVSFRFKLEERKASNAVGMSSLIF